MILDPCQGSICCNERLPSKVAEPGRSTKSLRLDSGRLGPDAACKVLGTVVRQRLSKTFDSTPLTIPR